MLLKNNSNKIIGILQTSILPEETAECPEGYEKNPVIKRYIAKGVLTIVDGQPEKAPEASGDSGENDNGDPAGKQLEEMTEGELTKYAVEHGIDVGRATSREGILKKIQEVQKDE